MPSISPLVFKNLEKEGACPSVFGNFTLRMCKTRGSEVLHTNARCATRDMQPVDHVNVRFPAVLRSELCTRCASELAHVVYSQASANQVDGLLLLLSALKETRILANKALSGALTAQELEVANNKLARFQIRSRTYYLGLRSRRPLSDAVDAALANFQMLLLALRFGGDREEVLKQALDKLPESVATSYTQDNSWVAVGVRCGMHVGFMQQFSKLCVVTNGNKAAGLFPKDAVYSLLLSLPAAPGQVESISVVELPATAGAGVKYVADTYFGALTAWVSSEAAEFATMCTSPQEYADFVPQMPNAAPTTKNEAKLTASNAKKTQKLMGAF